MTPEEYLEKLLKIDEKLAQLFNERMAVQREIAGYKISNDIPFADQEPVARGGNTYRDRFFKAVDEISNDFQLDFSPEHEIPQPARIGKFTSDIRVGYQGVEGSFGHMAMQAFFGTQVQDQAFNQFEDVFEALANNQIDYGILPIENSMTGAINDVYDFIGRYDMYIIGQQRIPVSQNLMALSGAKIENIRQVYSHPQGFLQSKEFLSKYPNLHRNDYANTATAAKMVSQSGDLTMAAIASPKAAELYGLQILAPDIHTEKSNTTRFVAIGRKFESQKSADAVSIFMTVKHIPGSLASSLEIIKDSGLNMINLQSRPIKNVDWDYSFYIDFEGRLSDKNVIRALTKLTNRCQSLRILGTFDQDN